MLPRPSSPPVGNRRLRMKSPRRGLGKPSRRILSDGASGVEKERQTSCCPAQAPRRLETDVCGRKARVAGLAGRAVGFYPTAHPSAARRLTGSSARGTIITNFPLPWAIILCILGLCR